MQLSITIPFYGSVEYLKEAVCSVLGQSDPRWRLFVVDDNYPSEEPARWLNTLNDDRINYIRNSSTVGVSANFNRCAKHADSEFLVILGGDDLLASNFVEWALNAVNANPEVSFLQPGVSVIDEKGRIIRPLADSVKMFLRPIHKTPITLEGKKLIESLALGNWLYFPSLVWRRDHLLQYSFDESYKVVQDIDLIMKMAFGGAKLALHNEKVFFYRRHRKSVSASLGLTDARYREEREFAMRLHKQLSEAGYLRGAIVSRMMIVPRLAALFYWVQKSLKLNSR